MIIVGTEPSFYGRLHKMPHSAQLLCFRCHHERLLNMNSSKTIVNIWWMIILVVELSSCAPFAPNEIPAPTAEYLKMKNQTFISPTNGAVFRLTLGELHQLHGNPEEVVPFPREVSGVRYATSSYYLIMPIDHEGYSMAESSITKGSEYAIDHIKIQYESDSGRILITEDISDGLSCKRYILFTPNRSGYIIDYLAPSYKYIPELDNLPHMILMSNDRAWVDGTVLPLSKIRKSQHPFSLGG